MNDLHRLLLSLAARYEGFAVGEVSGHTHSAVDHQVRRLAAKGLLHKAKLAHRTVRWCSTAAAAQRLVDAVGAHRAKRHELASAAKPRLLDQGGEVKYHPDFKGVEQCPHFVPRFQGPTIAPMAMQRGRVML